VTKLGVWITVSVTLAALILIGFLWAGLMYLFMDEFICEDRSPWWGPPEDPNSTCAGHWYESRHNAPFPQR
jgi:hypothetical protein